MLDYLANRESGKKRFNPKFYTSRYVHLKTLRKKLEELITPLLILKSGSTVVDMGCGERPYEPLFNCQAANYIGVDLPGNSNADIELNPITGKCKLPTSSADMILSIQVLEHVKDVSAYLSECNRLLMSGGNLILSTHGYWMFHPDPGDYWRWTRQGLELELNKHGFKIKEAHGVMGLLSTSLQLLQDAILISFPLKKYWGGAFCILMQLIISVSNELESYSKTLKTYRNKDASIFCVVAELEVKR